MERRRVLELFWRKSEDIHSRRPAARLSKRWANFSRSGARVCFICCCGCKIVAKVSSAEKNLKYIHAMASRGRHDSSLMVLVETLLLVCPLWDRKTDCIHNGVVMLVNVCMVWVLWQSRNCRIATRVRQAPIDGDFGRDHSSRLSISGQEN